MGPADRELHSCGLPERGDLIKSLGLWNEEEGVSEPAVVVLDKEGTARCLYSGGTDFSDRPPEEALEEVGASDGETPDREVADIRGASPMAEGRRAYIDSGLPRDQRSRIAHKDRDVVHGVRYATRFLSAYREESGGFVSVVGLPTPAPGRFRSGSWGGHGWLHGT